MKIISFFVTCTYKEDDSLLIFRTSLSTPCDKIFPTQNFKSSECLTMEERLGTRDRSDMKFDNWLEIRNMYFARNLVKPRILCKRSIIPFPRQEGSYLTSRHQVSQQRHLQLFLSLQKQASTQVHVELTWEIRKLYNRQFALVF